MTKQFLSVAEAVEAGFGSRSHLYRLRDAGRLRFVRIAGVVRIPLCELESLVEPIEADRK
jgi:hypothetical protein